MFKVNFWQFSNKQGTFLKKIYFNNNFLSWSKRHEFWSFFFSGFYLDDIFSISLKSFLTNMLIVPSFFIFDKWFSYWTGFGFIKSYLKFFNNLFYFESFDFFFFLFSLIFSIFFIFIFFFFFFYLLI